MNAKLDTWGVFGHGACSLPLITHGLAMGGHIRVGLEDSIYFAGNKLANSNAQLVERAASIARNLGRETATPTVARKLLGITDRRLRATA